MIVPTITGLAAGMRRVPFGAMGLTTEAVPMPPIITRQDAKALGLPKYFTGKPCKHGHVAERYTGLTTCIDCNGLAHAAYTVANLSRIKEYNRNRARAQTGAERERRILVNARRNAKRFGYAPPDPATMRPYPDDEVCDCCGLPSAKKVGNGRGSGLNLDHDHKTGQFRGWLCHLCNRGIGLLGDNIAGVDKAATYLHRAFTVDSPSRATASTERNGP